MIAKHLFLSAVLGITGANGLFPDTPQPLTPWQLQVKAKHRSMSDVCTRKKKTASVEAMCKRWEKRNA
jgi:hypothetical protein